MKISLQHFAEAVQGKKIVYLYRIYEEQATADGTTLALTTENGRTVDKDADSTVTKDGTIRTPSAAEIEITATSILAKDDVLVKKLEAAQKQDKLIEIWEANLDRPLLTAEGETATKFDGKYFQGYLTSLELTSAAEDMVEVSLTFGINGDGADGAVTVTVEQQEAAIYSFVDTPKVVTPPDPEDGEEVTGA